MSNNNEPHELIKRSPQREIKRENLLDVIDAQIGTGVQLLVIQAETGDGKTTLANAFLRRHHGKALGVTVSAASRWGYDPYCVIQSICAEACRLLGVPSNRRPDNFVESDLQYYYSRLARLGEGVGSVLFILDGLHEIPPQDDHIRRKIVDLIPIGLKGIVVIVTDSVPRQIALPTGANSSSWHSPRFTLDETKEYLSDHSIDSHLAREIHERVRGRPASLAVVRRLLAGGMTIESLLRNGSGELFKLFELEWQSIGDVSERSLRLFGLVVHARTALSVSDASRILEMSSEEVIAIAEKCAFVVRNVECDTIAPASDVARHFLATKSERLRGDVFDILISEELRRAKENEWSSSLPKYYHESEKWSELIQYLTPDRISASLARAEHLAPLNESLIAGLDAAKRLNRDDALYRFSVQSSALRELGRCGNWESLLGAHLALRDFEAAIQLSESVPLAADRLLLLASVASAQRLDNLTPQSTVIDRIVRLLEDVGPDLAPNDAVELAGKLFAVLPDHATKLLREASKSDAPGGTVDWAIARLSIDAAARKKATESSGGSFGDTGQAIRAEIRDPDVGRVAAMAAASLSSSSAADALVQAGKIESARDRLYFLRIWTDKNRTRHDALEVTVAALDLVVATNSYSPNARDLLMICRPLRHSANGDPAINCVNRITALLPDIEERGPTAEYYRLRVLLATVVFRWRPSTGQERILEEYIQLESIADPAIRSECLARMLSLLKACDPEGALERELRLHSTVQADLLKTIQCAADCSADHFILFSPVVTAIAGSHPELVKPLIAMVNTCARRDALRCEAIEHMLADNVVGQKIEVANELARTAESLTSKAEAAATLWTALSSSHFKGDVPIAALVQAVGLTSQCRDAKDQVITCALAFAVIRPLKFKEVEPTVEALKSSIVSGLDRIEDAWLKVDTALAACSAVAEADAELARICLEKAQTEQVQRLAGRPGQPWLVVAPLRLAMRALAGLMKQAVYKWDDVERLLLIMGDIPSTILRCDLRGELAAWLGAAGKITECQRIVDETILPELRGLQAESSWLLNGCIVAAAEGIFAARTATALRLFRDLPPEFRDVAVQRASDYKFRRVPDSEPFQEHGSKGFKINREDVEELLELASICDSDSDSWRIIERIGDSISGAARSSFPSQQSSAVAKDIERMSSELLPRKGWIQHIGYSVLWRACAKRISSKKWKPDADALRECDQIGNTSDRSFVYTKLATMVAPELRPIMLDRAASVAKGITVAHERVEHLGWVAEVALAQEVSAGRRLAEEVCLLARECEKGDMRSIQRRIMDSAYRANRDLAGAIAETVDTDEARLQARRNSRVLRLKERLGELKSRRALLEDPSQAWSPADLTRLPQAAWEELAAVNANRSTPRRLDEIRMFVERAATLPLDAAYPVVAWALACARHRLENTQQAGTILRPMFDAMVQVAQFTSRTAFGARGANGLLSSVSDSQYIVRIGREDDVREFLSDWIAKNVTDSLLICDPYFLIEDLWAIQLVLRNQPSAKVTVLTSNKSLPEHGRPDQAFGAAWRSLSNDDPPLTDIVIASIVGSDRFPLHDRWWLGHESGLRLGTSLGGLGHRVSEISRMDADASQAVRAQVEPFAVRRVRKMPDASGVKYVTFSL